MTIRTVTYDDATHVVAPIEPTDDMVVAAPFGHSNAYRKMIAAAPPFTSLPNPDLDVIEAELMFVHHNLKADGNLAVSIAISNAIAALKRLKGDV